MVIQIITPAATDRLPLPDGRAGNYREIVAIRLHFCEGCRDVPLVHMVLGFGQA